MIEADVVIVGAGFSGLVMAERIASDAGRSVVVIERRDHLGGNAHDYYDEHGVLVHGYGPHYFRTNSQKVLDYLSRFTEWRPAQYRILSHVDGELWPFPINLNTFEKLLGRPSTPEEMRRTLEEWREPIEHPRNSEEVIVGQVGWQLYRMFFEGYTLKQWSRHPRELDASICGRIPIRTNRDDRYLNEAHQVMPAEGYHRIFERLLEASPRVRVLLDTDFHAIRSQLRYRWLVYTGPIDAYFGRRFGELPYRSLRFEHESFEAEELVERLPVSGKPGFWQPVSQVNYPNSEAFTRIVEIKHVTGQACDNTTIVREYPQSTGAPYYPVLTPESKALYARYRELADAEPRTSFIGRLARYQYFNMDQVVGAALAEYERLVDRGVFDLEPVGG